MSLAEAQHNLFRGEKGAGHHCIAPDGSDAVFV
jgi:hypothetical protein